MWPLVSLHAECSGQPVIGQGLPTGPSQSLSSSRGAKYPRGAPSGVSQVRWSRPWGLRTWGLLSTHGPAQPQEHVWGSSPADMNTVIRCLGQLQREITCLGLFLADIPWGKGFSASGRETALRAESPWELLHRRAIVRELRGGPFSPHTLCGLGRE